MMRRRFDDLVERQLDLFAREHAALLEDCEAGLSASREEAKEHYGEHVELADAASDVRTLEPRAAEEHVSAFDRLARRRHRAPGLECE
jgi:hypothetical protein